jgi:hypothetical protein
MELEKKSMYEPLTVFEREIAKNKTIGNTVNKFMKYVNPKRSVMPRSQTSNILPVSSIKRWNPSRNITTGIQPIKSTYNAA